MIRIMQISALLVACLAAWGCSPRPSAGETCEREGFVRGTDAFATCYLAIQDRRSRYDAAVVNGILSRPPAARGLMSPGVCTNAGCTGQTTTVR